MKDTRNTWEGVTLAMQGMTMPVMTTIEGAPAGSAAAVAVTDANAWRLSVLGPITLSYAGRPADISGSERTLLALLSRAPGEEISTTSIITGMWGSSPPDAAEKTVASHIARLRKALTVVAPEVDPTGVVVTMPSGYILAIPPSNVDIRLFERLVADGQRALDLDRGMTQFIVGTGGRNLNGFGNFHTRPEIFARGQSNAFGFLDLRLRPSGWDYRWVSADGQPVFTDRGSGTCH